MNTFPKTWSTSSLTLDPFFVGWDDTLKRIENAFLVNSGTFPPYNVIKIDDDEFLVEFAVAGYASSDLKVLEDNGILIVEGETSENDRDYLHKGLASRKFHRTVSLGEHVHVKSAKVNNGMLCITLKREIPEEKKPKQIEIK